MSALSGSHRSQQRSTSCDGFESTVPSRSANDLGFAKGHLQYHDESIRKACFTTLSRHFLGLERSISLALSGDSRSPCLDKQASTQVQAILYDEGAKEPAQPKRMKPPIITSSLRHTAPYFATKTFPPPFEALDIRIRLPVRQPSESAGREIVRRGLRRNRGTSASSTTQPSEGVALISHSTSGWTRRGTVASFLLQFVEAHRHQQPGTSKVSLPRPSRPQ
ncbi:hypothetical protein GWK47_045573 [Chionoecetes opilio]|uniref:Uncharacterized protein n=1 Tax=Chionoecetes opilio TaxID=41210 RepID=A0A8J5CU33_CHIOP|nr:hypothetical protein GWK47_045573 [Chionoecetes opilio]